MKTKSFGIATLLMATVIWGGAFVAQSAGMESIGPFTFQAIRCFLAVAALVVLSFFMELNKLNLFWKKWADPTLWRAGIFCGLALFAATSLQQVGLVSTDAGKAGFITALYIVIVPLIELLLHKKPGIMTFVSIGIAVCGMYLLCGADLSQIKIGDILLMLCAVAFAVQITLVDRLGKQHDPLRLNSVQALTVTVLSLPFLLTENLDGNLILSCWLPLTYAGVLSMGLSYALQIIGQRLVESSTAALLMSLESVFAAVFGALILKDQMQDTELIGCVLMFAAVILSQLPGKKQPASR